MSFDEYLKGTHTIINKEPKGESLMRVILMDQPSELLNRDVYVERLKGACLNAGFSLSKRELWNLTAITRSTLYRYDNEKSREHSVNVSILAIYMRKLLEPAYGPFRFNDLEILVTCALRHELELSGKYIEKFSVCGLLREDLIIPFIIADQIDAKYSTNICFKEIFSKKFVADAENIIAKMKSSVKGSNFLNELTPLQENFKTLYMKNNILKDQDIPLSVQLDNYFEDMTLRKNELEKILKDNSFINTSVERIFNEIEKSEHFILYGKNKKELFLKWGSVLSLYPDKIRAEASHAVRVAMAALKILGVQ